MKKLIALVLSTAILGAAHRVDATQITIKNSTGQDELHVFTNADIDGCGSIARGVITGAFTFGISLAAVAGSDSPSEQNRWRDQIIFDRVTLCTWGPLVVTTTNPAYVLKGDKNDFYSQVVIPAGQIWHQELVPASVAGSRPIVKMPR